MFERIHAPQYSLQHCLQQPRHGSNLTVTDREMDKEDVGGGCVHIHMYTHTHIYRQWNTTQPLKA